MLSLISLFHHITPTSLSEMSNEDLSELRTSELNTGEDWELIDKELDKRKIQ